MDSFLSIPGIAFLAVTFGVIYHFIVYPAFISPLARIPNAHWSAPFSSCWIYYTRYKCRENRLIHAAHVQHGEVVRLGPNELSVNCVDDGIRTIFGGGFAKPDWYAFFDNFGVPCMFSSLGSKEHSARKKMISHVYSKSVVHNSPTLHAQAQVIIYDRLLPLIYQGAVEAPAQGVDVMDLWNGTTMDFITAYQFGLSTASNFLQHKQERQYWLQVYMSRREHTFWAQEFPRFTEFCHSWGYRLIPRWVDDANSELEGWVRKKCQLGAELVASKSADAFAADPQNNPVVLRALISGLEKEESAKGNQSVLAATVFESPELSVASEMFDQLAAGHETSAITMAYVSWYLSQDLDLQAKLRQELLTLETPVVWNGGRVTDRGLPDAKRLDGLPLLHAVLMETLRIKAAIPGSQPRMTPYPTCKLGTYQVPGGVRVNAAAYHLHRNGEVFPDPLRWNPDRWLDTAKDQKKDRDRWFWAFSSGGRMCIGSNFAVHELKLLIATVYTNFTTHIVDDAGIEQADGYTVGPIRNKLFLRFEPVTV